MVNDHLRLISHILHVTGLCQPLRTQLEFEKLFKIIQIFLLEIMQFFYTFLWL